MSQEDQSTEFANLDEELDNLANKAQNDVATPAQDAYTLPDTLQDKSREEIAKMLQDAQSQIGKLGNELGQTRQLADEVLKSQALANQSQASAPVEEEDNSVDFFVDPKSAVNAELAKNPVLRGLQDKLQKQEQREAQQAVYGRHPDATEVVSSPEFQAWVNQSPVRLRQFKDAANYDAASGIELLDTYKALHNKAETNGLSTKANQSLQAAQTPSSTGGSSSASRSSGKIYRASDIRKLALTNPKKYNSPEVQREIMTAYNEGRVRR